MAATTNSREHRIPLPTGRREALKANVFERMQSANTELVPLFPYYGPGAMVPCGALFRGGPDNDMGHFFHFNTQEEIVCVYGANGALLKTGQVLANPKLHGVNSFLREPESSESFLVLTVTQRQTDGEGQDESLIFRCGACHEHLLEHRFSTVPAEESEDRWPDFPTLGEGVEPVERFNADESIRTCPKCGFVNPTFPLDKWGWGQWSRQRETVNMAWRALRATSSEQLAEA